MSWTKEKGHWKHVAEDNLDEFLSSGIVKTVEEVVEKVVKKTRKTRKKTDEKLE